MASKRSPPESSQQVYLSIWSSLKAEMCSVPSAGLKELRISL